MGKEKGKEGHLLSLSARLGEAGEAHHPRKRGSSGGEELQQRCFGCICVGNRLRSVFFLVETCRMIVSICRSNGIPQTMSVAGDIPGDVHAAAVMPVEGAAPSPPAPRPPQRHKCATSLHIQYKDSVPKQNDATQGGGALNGT